MSAIRILPENLANQIAAGEVVERPASVIKELLENAVDAGARNISVQVEGKGVGLLRVSDDGKGMDGDDLLLCLERHATSKVTDAAGLAAINTLGFRGEALPSIASISRLRLSSRPPWAALGTLVEVAFGTVRMVRETGAALGTVVEVRDLFGNVPARRKFLKSPRTELYHVEECVKNCGLACPGLGVHYQVDGRTVLQWPAGVDDAAGRIRRLLGKREAAELLVVGSPAAVPRDHLLPVDPGDRLHTPGVFGLLPAPEDLPATGARLRVFVNGRPVRDRMLTHAVAEGLHNQLLRGRQPAGVIFLRVDPATVDVNVHPTKQEIRFQQPATVHDAVREAVRAALGEQEQQRSRTLFGAAAELAVNPSAADSQPVTDHRDRLPQPWPSPAVPGRLFQVREAGEAPFRTDQADAESDHASPSQQPQPAPPRDLLLPVDPGKRLRPLDPGLEPPPQAGAAATDPGADLRPLPATLVSRSAPVPASAALPEREAVPGENAPRLLGQVLRSYIICAGEDGLLAVDQHAAHERLLYERLLAQYNDQGLSRQALLFPEVLECSPEEAAVLENRHREITRLGLQVEAFGGHSYVVKAVPALLAAHSPTAIVAGVLSRFLASPAAPGEGSPGGGRLESVLAGMACKAAVKAGQSLAAEEMQALLREMQAAGIFSRCPHGRPVARHFTGEEMKKWFKR